MFHFLPFSCIVVDKLYGKCPGGIPVWAEITGRKGVGI